MSDPKSKIAASLNGGQSKTIIWTAATGVALMIYQERGRLKDRPIAFKDAQAALAWCIAGEVKFIYLPPTHQAN